MTQFREMIRFHVQRDRVTGYVISIEGAAPAANRGEDLVFTLRDVFTIEPTT